MLTVKIVPNASGSPAGKLADAELHFEALGVDAQIGAAGSILSGMKLIGFAIWERKNGPGRNVTFPARQYSVNGERRSYALLRPQAIEQGTAAQDRIRDLILAAMTAYEAAIDAEPIEPGALAGTARDLSSFNYRA